MPGTNHRRLQNAALWIFGAGLVLMVRQMYFDGEPGAIPLLLILLGLTGFFFFRRRSRADSRNLDQSQRL